MIYALLNRSNKSILLEQSVWSGHTVTDGLVKCSEMVKKNQDFEGLSGFVEQRFYKIMIFCK